MLVGASLSLSPFQRQGERARDGLRLWVDHVRDARDGPRRLIVLDDRSRATLAQEHVRRLLAEERVDVLVGPYSSGLILAVAPIAAAAGEVLWNHGGTSDVIFQEAGRHVVSVPSPASDYLRDLPGWIRRRAPGASRVGILHATFRDLRRPGGRGAAEGARAAGFSEIRLMAFELPPRDARAVLREAAAAEPDLVVGVGAFPDDVAIARQRAALPARTALALVGAGLSASATRWAASPRRRRPSTAASAATRRRGDRSATGSSWSSGAANVRLCRLAAEVLAAVDAGIFPPQVGSHCPDCPVRNRCWVWGSRTAV